MGGESSIEQINHQIEIGCKGHPQEIRDLQPRCQTVGAGKNEDHPDDECPQHEQPDKGKEIDAEGKKCNAPREVKEQLDGINAGGCLLVRL